MCCATYVNMLGLHPILGDMFVLQAKKPFMFGCTFPFVHHDLCGWPKNVLWLKKMCLLYSHILFSSKIVHKGSWIGENYLRIDKKKLWKFFSNRRIQSQSHVWISFESWIPTEFHAQDPPCPHSYLSIAMHYYGAIVYDIAKHMTWHTILKLVQRKKSLLN